jgi:hypothetical protein
VTTELPGWVSILGALSTPTIAVFGLYIAWRQWQTGRSKLKLDLFEKRYAVYAAAQAFVKSVNAHGNATPEDIQNYRVGVSQCEFLFDGKIGLALNPMLVDAYELQTLNLTLGELRSTDERKKNVEQQRAIKERINDRFQEMSKQMAPFLNLQH